MSQGNPKQTAGTPMRYSSRHKIFSKRESAQNSQRSTQQDQTYKLLAKIRSLQDDIRALTEKNQRIQLENHELMRMENQAETAVVVQEAEILSLTERIEYQEAASETILQYERKLQEVGGQVSLLTELITHKNQKYEMLKFEKEKVAHQNLKLKEESNKFQYEQIQTEEKVDQLIDLVDPERLSTLDDDLPQKIEKIVDQCRILQQKIASKEDVLQNIKKEGTQAVLQQKEKQIQIEFNVKLLKERGRDVQQKNNYFVNCYNEESIKAVIDDMLLKEHALRKELDQQLEMNAALQMQTQQAMTAAKKRVQRERSNLLQELKLQKMQNEMYVKKRQRAQADFQTITNQTLPLQQESTQISKQVIEDNAQVYERIKKLESQNIILQMSLATVNEEILLLRRQLNV